MAIYQESAQYKRPTSRFGDEDARWQAVQARESSADGVFVYAVKTTKIYCRPICKARLARRANVAFYDTGVEAQGAGFRACKRCKPELAGYMPEELAVRKIRAFVEEQQKQKQKQQQRGGNRSSSSSSSSSSSVDARLISLSQMARQTGLSKWHFHRVFKRCVGKTPSEFLRSEKEATEAAATTADWSSSSSSSQSPAIGGGTLSQWIGSDLDAGFGWLPAAPREGEEEEGLGSYDLLDFALFDMDAVGGGGLAPWSEAAGQGWGEGDNISLDDFLVWPGENGNKGW